MVAGASDRECLRIGPFTARIDPLRKLFYVSFAVPDPGVGAQAGAAIAYVARVFRERDRTPRTAFVEELSPELPAVLESHGWRLTERIPILTCEPGRLRGPPVPDGVEIRVVPADAPPAVARGFAASPPRSATTSADDREPARGDPEARLGDVVDVVAVDL